MLTGLLPWDVAHGSCTNYALFRARPASYFARVYALPADADALLAALLAPAPAARPPLGVVRAAVRALGPLFAPEQRAPAFFHARRGEAPPAKESEGGRASLSDEDMFLDLSDDEDTEVEDMEEDASSSEEEDDDDEAPFPAPVVPEVAGAKVRALADESPYADWKPAVHSVPLALGGRRSVDLDVKEDIAVGLRMDGLML
jgi:hypothetical protein